MTTTVQPNPSTTPAAPPARYRAVSPLAVISVILGAASIVLFFHWTMVVVPLAGLICGWRALRRIDSSEDMTGVNVAVAGMALSAVMGGLGGMLLVLTGRYEVPMGYRAISFSDLQPDLNDREQLLPPLVDKLEGERVFIRGFIYPGRQASGLKQFIFVPSVSHCNFCSQQLRSTEMIMVKMGGDLTAEYTTRLTRVGGRLKVDREAAKERFGSMPYTIECDYVR